MTLETWAAVKAAWGGQQTALCVPARQQTSPQTAEPPKGAVKPSVRWSSSNQTPEAGGVVAVAAEAEVLGVGVAVQAVAAVLDVGKVVERQGAGEAHVLQVSRTVGRMVLMQVGCYCRREPRPGHPFLATRTALRLAARWPLTRRTTMPQCVLLLMLVARLVLPPLRMPTALPTPDPCPPQSFVLCGWTSCARLGAAV